MLQHLKAQAFSGTCDRASTHLEWINKAVVSHRLTPPTHVLLNIPTAGNASSLVKFDYRASGFTSTVFRAAPLPEYPNGLVIKVLNSNPFRNLYIGPPRSIIVPHEVCILRRLNRSSWVPRVLCSNGDAFVMTAAGDPLVINYCHHNLPDIALAQAEAIIRDMRAVGVAHNDLWKWHTRVCDLMVDRNGSLSAVDFNWGTVYGNYSCDAQSTWPAGDPLQPSSFAVLNDHGNRTTSNESGAFVARNDSDILVLVAQFLVERRYYKRREARLKMIREYWLKKPVATHADPVRHANSTPSPVQPLPPPPQSTLADMPLEDNQTELHLLILWDTTIPTAKDVYSRALHERTFSTVKVEVRPSIASRVARIAFMNAFYEASRHNKDVDDIRGTCPFVVMFVHARRSDYGQCLGGSATRHVARCAPTNAFKSRVRAQTHTRTSVYAIHGTDNVEETRDNLRVLGFNTDDYETLAQQRRVSWPSLEVMLAAIDGAGGYVVQRDFEGWRGTPGEVDLFVGNVSAAVAVLGALPATTPWNTAGMAPNGTRVRYVALVNGRSVDLDLRSPGDGYMDAQWTRDVLARRIRRSTPHSGFYVMDRNDHFFSLLYHSLVHKTSFEHRSELVSMAAALNEAAAAESTTPPVSTAIINATQQNRAADALEALRLHYMAVRGYAFTVPTDKTVYFRPQPERLVEQK